MGIYISLAGPVTFKNAGKAYQVAEEIPLEWLLVETDSPYLTLYRTEVKERTCLCKVCCAKIAEAKQISIEEVAHQTTSNTKNCLG